jgi:hypothetical protein
MWLVPRLLAGCALLLLGGTRVAEALVLDAATVTVRPARTDGFQLKGRLGPTSLDGATAITVALGPFRMQVPLDRTKRKKQVVTFKDTAPGARISRLRLDLRRGKFLVVGDEWVLANLPNPLDVSVGTDLGADCRTVRLENPKARRPRKRPPSVTGFVLGKNADAGACGALTAPRPRPVAVTAGTPTSVLFEVDAVNVDPGSVQLVRLDAAGRVAGEPLCTMAPDGPRFACTATIGEASPGDLTLFVRGTAGGAPVASTGFVLPIVPPRSAADAQMLAQADAAVIQARDAALAQLGDTLAARMALLRALAAVPGISGAALSPNGVDVVYRYANGWLGGLILNRGLGTTPAPSVATRRAATVAASPAVAGLRPSPRVLFRTCGGSEGVCCQAKDRREAQLARKVLVWDAGYFGPGRDDAPVVAAKFAEWQCLGHDVTTLFGPAATVQSVKQFTSAATLVISTHGVVNRYGRVMFATGETISDIRDEIHHDDMVFGLVGRYPMTDTVGIYTVSEDFVRLLPGSFPERAIVYASYCYSGYKDALAAYVSKGAGVAFGYDWKVHDTYAIDVATQLFDGLLGGFKTAGDAYDAVDPKIDPTPLTGSLPGRERDTWLEFTVPAYFVYEGNQRIAYVAQPDITPDASTVGPGESATLTASAEGSGTCELKYHWYTDGTAGDLTGDTGTNDFESTEPTATYTAHEEPAANDDAVAVELSSPQSDGIGTSCAEANVVTTTTSSTTTTSTTVPTCGAGVVLSAVVTEEILAGAFTHVMNGADDLKPFTFPQTAIPATPTTNDAKPWDNLASGGGAEAHSAGNVTWSIAPCAITASGTFDESSIGGSATATAQTGLDATLQIAFEVSREAPFHLEGFVQASGTPKDGPNTVFYARCSAGGIGIVEASLQNPTGVPVPFSRDSTAFPGEQIQIICGVRRGGASADGTGDDMGSIDWSFTFTFE